MMSEQPRAKSSLYASAFVDDDAKHEFVRLCVASIMMSFSTAHTIVAALAFQRSGFDLSSIGILLSSMSIPTILGSLFSGALIARYGVLAIMRIAMLCAFIAIGSLVFTHDMFYPALISRLLWGAGVGLFLPCGIVYAQSRLNPSRSVYFISVYSSMMPVSQAFAPVLGEFMLVHFGVGAMFAVAAAPAAIGCLASFHLRPLERPARKTGLAMTNAFQKRSFLPIVAMLLSGSIYGYSMAYLAPSIHERGLSLGAFFLPSTLALLGGRFGGMRILGSMHPRNLVNVGLILSALGIFTVAFAHNIIVVAMAGLLFGAGNSILYPVACSWITQGIPAPERGGPIALATTAFYFGLYAMPFPQTYLIASFGYTSTEVILSVIGFIGSLLLIIAPKVD
jgi:MFS family permease